MTNEQYPTSLGPEQDPADTEARFNDLWECGDKVGALETAMGRYVNAEDISTNTDLATVILQPSASEAFAAAMLVKTLEEIAAE